MTISRIQLQAAEAGKSMMAVIEDADTISEISRAAKSLTSFASMIADLREIAARGTVQDALEHVVRHSGLVAMWSAFGSGKVR